MHLQLATTDHIANHEDHPMTADRDEDTGLIEAIEHPFFAFVGISLPTLDAHGYDLIEG